MVLYLKCWSLHISYSTKKENEAFYLKTLRANVYDHDKIIHEYTGTVYM